MSSLAISFEITQINNCGALLFDDLTEYGQGGGSGELPSYADVGKTTIEFDFDNGEKAVIGNFVPAELIPETEIFAADLGYTGDNIPDQIVTVTYTIYDLNGNVIGTASQPVLFCCNFLSCWYANAQTVVADRCCNKKKLAELMELWTRFLGIQASVACNACCASGAMEDLSMECSKFCLTGGC